ACDSNVACHPNATQAAPRACGRYQRTWIPSEGVVTLAETKRKTNTRDRCSKSNERTLGAACESTPRVEARGKLLAIERGAQQMALECEVLADGTEAREKRLRAFRPAKTSHAPLAL